MANTQCKTCRRAGQKFFLKEEKCFGAKCVLVRKPYPPGLRPKKVRPTKSEYGFQLKEKQALKSLYNLKERQFVNYVNQAKKTGGAGTAARLMKFLESRLDNTVFKMGFAKSRSTARQLVSHGHITVNDKKVSISSFLVKKGDIVAMRIPSLSKESLKNLDIWLKKYNPPAWLKLDKNKKQGQVFKDPEIENIEADINLDSIIEFYSR